jgi:farnesyl-diphosphate farnesyltransferase
MPVPVRRTIVEPGEVAQPVGHITHLDVVWARVVLPRVSRTFALSIQALEAPSDTWVTTSYLLCRVLDTVEDAPDLTIPERHALFVSFLEALTTRDATSFGARAARLPDGDEGALARDLGRVLRPVASFPAPVQTAITRWVAEMARGMDRYAKRGLPFVLADEKELHDYCYVVAGTVGHLLTDLFACASTRVAARSTALHGHAEGFARLLQLTNIAKDFAVDRARGWSFAPRSWAEPDGVRCVDRLVALARSNRPSAWAYVSLLEDPALLRFCLVPLLLADHTLDLVEGNPDVLVSSPKLSRAEVAHILEDVEDLVSERG